MTKRGLFRAFKKDLREKERNTFQFYDGKLQLNSNCVYYYKGSIKIIDVNFFFFWIVTGACEVLATLA